MLRLLRSSQITKPLLFRAPMQTIARRAQHTSSTNNSHNARGEIVYSMALAMPVGLLGWFAWDQWDSDKRREIENEKREIERGKREIEREKREEIKWREHVLQELRSINNKSSGFATSEKVLGEGSGARYTFK
ncbi:hypothetical protein I302_101683 [Kwoniella bestiolae CBS 10118]|uniref:Uncharacterized protein n=1 Tax=Kwoniella bestiolae CBS 10118 TaxID=1296100 RepID=A0A1B9GCY3_9TREE|nr:hypothetical protein I302_00360 [Kwoniella bestiolae CBS 10118]OCF28870.1 hypothetical protein I302_00360 [Kwoniella bestiolae CBS 10118]